MDYEKLFEFLDASRKSFDMFYNLAKAEYENTGTLSEDMQDALNVMFGGIAATQTIELTPENIDSFISDVNELEE